MLRPSFGGGASFGGGTTFGGGSSNFDSFYDSSSSSGDDDDDVFGALSPAPSRSHKPPKRVRGSRTTFILGDKLGEGAYATVKEGIDENSLRIVAVKILDLRRLRRQRVLASVDREVAVQKALKRHRNIIEQIDVIRPAAPKTSMYIVLEMATGCTVADMLKASPNNCLVESQVANLCYQTLCGLAYIHGKGVVHRDIKPDNLMLLVDGTLKISDFGVAEFLNKYEEDDNVTRTSGSPAFQAPEIARGDTDYSGTKVDVWALGVTVYMLLSGSVPFKGDMLLALFDNIVSGDYKQLEDVSPECQEAISAMLTMKWEERPGVEQLLRLPWFTDIGAVERSQQEKENLGWMPVPKKQFRILDVVKRMYMNDEDVAPSSVSPSTAGPAVAAPRNADAQDPNL